VSIKEIDYKTNTRSKSLLANEKIKHHSYAYSIGRQEHFSLSATRLRNLGWMISISAWMVNHMTILTESFKLKIQIVSTSLLFVVMKVCTRELLVRLSLDLVLRGSEQINNPESHKP
jgi:hypothetical protein